MYKKCPKFLVAKAEKLILTQYPIVISYLHQGVQFQFQMMGGAHPKNQIKPVASPKSVNWHCFFLFFFVCFFFGFLGIGFGQNSKLETVLVFFWFFWLFFGFFWFFLHRPWPTFEIGNWFFGLRWFFLVFFGFFGFFLVFQFRVRIPSQIKPKKNQKKNQKKKKKTKKKQKKPKKKQKKTVATKKLVNWLCFFGFFFGFLG